MLSDSMEESDDDLQDSSGSDYADSVGEPADDETDQNEQDFDITLAASHSYMEELEAVGGRCVLEPGWEGAVPVGAHHGAVFPGETVPLLATRSEDAALLAAAVRRDGLFGLLCPERGGWGVLCEVYEAGGAAAGLPRPFKARATHRFRLVDPEARARLPVPADRMRVERVVVLAERGAGGSGARLCSLDPLRRPRQPRHWLQRRVRALDAATTPWPAWVHAAFELGRLRAALADYFGSIGLDKLPEDAVSLSFWVASNLPLSSRDRFSLFVADNALHRLYLELAIILHQKSVLCCASCSREITRREYIIPMSSEGVHSNYTNLGGFMHDVVTVSAVRNTRLAGAPSAQFSWFPGYAWRVAQCAACRAHVGWRFQAGPGTRLRPRRFYALCRNYVQPRHDPASADR